MSFCPTILDALQDPHSQSQGPNILKRSHFPLTLTSCSAEFSISPPLHSYNSTMWHFFPPWLSLAVLQVSPSFTSCYTTLLPFLAANVSFLSLSASYILLGPLFCNDHSSLPFPLFSKPIMPTSISPLTLHFQLFHLSSPFCFFFKIHVNQFHSTFLVSKGSMLTATRFVSHSFLFASLFHSKSYGTVEAVFHIFLSTPSLTFLHSLLHSLSNSSIWYHHVSHSLLHLLLSNNQVSLQSFPPYTLHLQGVWSCVLVNK